MNRRTRYFLIVSALIVVVGLGTGLVARYGSVIPFRSSPIGPAELAYVPPDVTSVAYADVRQIMGAPFLQQLRQTLPTGAAKDQFLAETGIDLEHDIDTVVAGFSAGQTAGTPVGLLRGRFNTAQIEATAVQRGATVEDYRGKRVLVLQLDQLQTKQPLDLPGAPPRAAAGSGHAGAVAFLEPGLIACGEVAGVKRAIDAAATHTDITKNAELMKFIGDVEHSADAWVVGRFDAMVGNSSLPEQVKSQLPMLDSFVVSARFENGISGRIHIDARDDKAAEELRAVVNGGLAAAKLMLSQDPRLAASLSSLQTSGVGKAVELSFDVPPDVLQSMAGVAARDLHPANGVMK